MNISIKKNNVRQLTEYAAKLKYIFSFAAEDEFIIAERIVHFGIFMHYGGRTTPVWAGNPVRKGFISNPLEWKYSSAKDSLTDAKG